MVINSLSRRAAVTAALLLTCAAGAQAATAVIQARPNPIARIELSTPRDKLLAGETVSLPFAAFDALEQPIANPRLSFRVTPPIVAKVSSRGVLTARKAGTATVVAVSGRVTSNPISIIVNEVGRIDITPAGPISLNAGDTFVFQAQAYDVNGVPLPNADYPTVPLTWKSTAGGAAPITQRGGLRTPRPCTTLVSASVGRVRSALARVLVGRRNLARSTRVFLTGEPDGRLSGMYITIDRVELATPTGEWRPLVTRPEIDALVGQPINMLALVNRRVQIGTGFLPDSEYQRMRIVLSSDSDANYMVLSDGTTRVPLPFEQPEDSTFDAPFYLYLTPGFPLSVVLDFRTPDGLNTVDTSTPEAGPSSTTYLTPDWDGVVMDDEELSQPFGALVGRVQDAGNADVFATNVDDGGTIVNYFGRIDPDTGDFRIGQLPSGRYELHVAVPGHAEWTLGNLVIGAGRDNVLPQPIVVP